MTSKDLREIYAFLAAWFGGLASAHFDTTFAGIAAVVVIAAVSGVFHSGLIGSSKAKAQEGAK